MDLLGAGQAGAGGRGSEAARDRRGETGRLRFRRMPLELQRISLRCVWRSETPMAQDKDDERAGLGDHAS